MAPLAACALALLLAALPIACRSGANTPKPTASASETTAASAPTPVVTPASRPTPLDPSQFTMQTVDAGPDTFTLEVPIGWQSEGVAAPAGFNKRFFMTKPDGSRLVQVTVRCQPYATIDEMTRGDQTLVSHLNGHYEIASAIERTVGDVPAKQVDFDLSIGGTLTEQRSVYFNIASCGWRLTLQTFGEGQRFAYSALFDRVVATFHSMVPTAPVSTAVPTTTG